MTGRIALTYIEIDIIACANTYGTAPCTASVPTTGPIKCFNSVRTCQDRAHYTNTTVTLRFGMDVPYNPKSIRCFPMLKSVAVTPAVISLGKNLGQRASVTAVLSDRPHSDTGSGFDQYLSTRTYNPYTQGSFWGKFRARHYLQNCNMRLIRGFVGQALADMETHHYVIETSGGPDTSGNFTITAKDVLKLADDDRSQCPRLSNGSLLAGINNSVTSATLNPAGIGNLEYPASGLIAIGGKEIVSFTRAADVLTITRAQKNTVAIAHNAGELMQLCVSYTSQSPADIAYDLITNYTDIDASFITLAEWQTELTTYFGQLLTGTIATPTGVATLLSEIIEQCGLACWWDDKNQKIRLQVLKAIAAGATTFSRDRFRMDGTLRIQEQDSTRLTEVQMFFGQRNPLDPQTNHDNYQLAVFRDDLQKATDYGSSAIKSIFSRWIPTAGLSIASRGVAIILGRYVDPPRKFSFDLFRSDDLVVELGGTYYLDAWMLQDATGAATSVPVQITQLAPAADKISVVAEEMLFTHYDSADLSARTVTLGNDFDANIKTLHDSIYPALTATDVTNGVTVTVVVPVSVIAGASSTSVPAVNIGTGWPVGAAITVKVYGRIQGHGGDGGGFSHNNGYTGGTALLTTIAITLVDATGQIWAGGGGGGAGGGSGSTGGGGGAGTSPGAGGASKIPTDVGSPGTASAGGAGATLAGAGGGPGLVGANGNFTGGARGNAIDGISHVTTSGGAGDRRGATIN